MEARWLRKPRRESDSSTSTLHCFTSEGVCDDPPCRFFLTPFLEALEEMDGLEGLDGLEGMEGLMDELEKGIDEFNG